MGSTEAVDVQSSWNEAKSFIKQSEKDEIRMNEDPTAIIKSNFCSIRKAALVLHCTSEKRLDLLCTALKSVNENECSRT